MNHTYFSPDTVNKEVAVEQAGTGAAARYRTAGGRQTSRNDITTVLQAMASGTPAGAVPLQAMDSISAGSRQLGNRAFLHWVSELRAANLKPDNGEITALKPQSRHRSMIGAVALQFGPKPRRKKKQDKVAQAGTTPEVLPETVPPAGPASGPGAQETTVRVEPGTAPAPTVKKKKRKSRGQAAGKPAVPPVKKELGVREKELFEYCYDGKTDRRFYYLLRHGHFDINASNREGTMLGVAAYFGHDGVLEALLSVADIKVNLLQQGGYTPLYTAVDNAREETVRLLAADGRVDVNLGVPGRYTPLHNAVERKNENIIRSLLAHPGIHVNARKPNGTTALLIAAQDNLPRIVPAVAGTRRRR